MFPPFFATPTERHHAQLDANLHHLKLHLSPHIQAEEKRQALIDKQNTKLLQRIVDIMTSKKKSFPVAETRRKVMVGHKSVLINMQLIIIYHPPNVLYMTDCIALLAERKGREGKGYLYGFYGYCVNW